MLEDTRNAAPVRRVVFFGDSRAAWWDVPVVPELDCVAVGVPGASAPYLARRFRPMVAPLRPDVVVLQLGVNDLTGLAPSAAEIATTSDAILAVVAAARDLGAQVVVTTIFPPADDGMVPAALRLAIDYVNQDVLSRLDAEIRMFDSAAVLAGPDGWVRPEFADDAVHLSVAGYAALNAALVPLLVGLTGKNSR